MKKLIYEIPVHDDNDAEMIAREIEAVLGIRPRGGDCPAVRQAGKRIRAVGWRFLTLRYCSGSE